MLFLTLSAPETKYIFWKSFLFCLHLKNVLNIKQTMLICHLLSTVCQKEWQIYSSNKCWSKDPVQPRPELLLCTTVDKNLEKELSIDFPDLFWFCINRQCIHMQYPYQKKLLYRYALSYILMHKICRDLTSLICKYFALSLHFFWHRKP